MGELENAGFVDVSREVYPRICMAVTGLQGQGKSYFSLTAPGPLTLLNDDRGLEGVANKFPEEKKIMELEYSVLDEDYDFDLMQRMKTGSKDEKHEAYQENAKKYIETWDRVKGAYMAAMDAPHEQARTVVIDTNNGLYDLIRMARFGRMEQVPQLAYVPVNAELKTFYNKYKTSMKNLILIHQAKKVYKVNAATKQANWTGKYERGGWGGIGFVVQVELWIDMQEKLEDGVSPEEAATLEVIKCRQRPELTGKVYEYPMNTFPWIAMDVIEGTSLEDWWM